MHHEKPFILNVTRVCHCVSSRDHSIEIRWTWVKNLPMIYWKCNVQRRFLFTSVPRSCPLPPPRPFFQWGKRIITGSASGPIWVRNWDDVSSDVGHLQVRPYASKTLIIYWINRSSPHEDLLLKGSRSLSIGDHLTSVLHFVFYCVSVQ